VELATAGARSSLRFDVAPMGSGQAIICVDVAPGSEALEVRSCSPWQRAFTPLPVAVQGLTALLTVACGARLCSRCSTWSAPRTPPLTSSPQEGVRPGMRLTAISDPIRRNEVWKLQDR
jgi:hypothetical protein